MQNLHFSVSNIDGEQYVVIKGAVPKSLKLQFKVLCVQQELEMSAVLEDLIEQWIQADAPIHEPPADLYSEDSEDVKGYIPKSLKLPFKTLCTLKQVKMRSVLYQLLHEWVQAQE
ncbi:MAG: hypothetical protein AB1589_15935 [Cyanobacteriota bacterium]